MYSFGQQDINTHEKKRIQLLANYRIFSEVDSLPFQQWFTIHQFVVTDTDK